MVNWDIFFSKNFNIEGFSIHILQDDFKYTILFKSIDNSFSTSLKIKFGIYQKSFSVEDEELIKNLVTNHVSFNNNQIFSNIIDVINYLQKL